MNTVTTTDYDRVATWKLNSFAISIKRMGSGWRADGGSDPLLTIIDVNANCLQLRSHGLHYCSYLFKQRVRAHSPTDVFTPERVHGHSRDDHSRRAHSRRAQTRSQQTCSRPCPTDVFMLIATAGGICSIRISLNLWYAILDPRSQ